MQNFEYRPTTLITDLFVFVNNVHNSSWGFWIVRIGWFVKGRFTSIKTFHTTRALFFVLRLEALTWISISLLLEFVGYFRLEIFLKAPCSAYVWNTSIKISILKWLNIYRYYWTYLICLNKVLKPQFCSFKYIN